MYSPAVFENSIQSNNQRTHTGERPFACDYKGCGKRFRRNDQLKRHQKIHSRAFKCTNDGCWRAFDQMDQLQQHLNSGRCIADKNQSNKSKKEALSLPPLDKVADKASNQSNTVKSASCDISIMQDNESPKVSAMNGSKQRLHPKTASIHLTNSSHHRKIRETPPLLREIDHSKPTKGGFFQNKQHAPNESTKQSNECKEDMNKDANDYVDFHTYASNKALNKMKWSAMRTSLK